MTEDFIAFKDQVIEVLTTYGLEVVGAIAILIVGWMVAGWAKAGTRRALQRVTWMDNTVRPVFASIVGYLVMVVTLIAVLNQFGVETTSIIAVLGAAGLAVGLALQGTLSNVAAGVMLLFLRPFQVGDYITAGGVGGTVKEIGLFNTELATPDNVYIVVPNSSIIGGAISNYSRHATRRLDIAIGVGYDTDLGRGMDVLRGVIDADGRALADPVREVMVTELGDSAITLNMRFWVNAGDYWGCKFDLTKAAKEALDAAGIEIPFPQQVVHHRQEPAAD